MSGKGPFCPVLSTVPVWPPALFHPPCQWLQAMEMELQPGFGKGPGLRASNSVGLHWRLASGRILKLHPAQWARAL